MSLSGNRNSLNLVLLIDDRAIILGKLAKTLYVAEHAFPHVERPGDVFYVTGLLLGLVLWGFAIMWFAVAAAMIATSGTFPFNMGWWGFVFPIGGSACPPGSVNLADARI